MLSFRSTKRTNWQIQWVDLSLSFFFFLRLWSIWQRWSHSPFWTFETLFSLILCPNSLPVLLLLLWLFLLHLFCKQSSFPVPTLECWCQKKKMLMSARVQLWPSSHSTASADTYVLMTLKSAWSPNRFWSLDPNTQLPAGQLHLHDSNISNSVYPTHWISGQSNQSTMPVSVNDTTITSARNLGVILSLSFLNQISN